MGIPFAVVTTASTNQALIRNGGPTLMEITLSNPTLTPCAVKLYDKATAPVAAADTPRRVWLIAAGGTVHCDFGVGGASFAAGLGLVAVGALAQGDVTAAPAGVLISGTLLS